MTAVATKTCFVISPIGEAGSETRRKADEVFEYLLKPIVGEFGYKAVRADHIDESGTITTQIIQQLISSELVIADLSERNPNVFYELSVRHFSRRPFIQLISVGEPIPFDVAANRTIQYDLNRLPVAEAAKSQIRAQIKGIEAGADETENPISTAIDLSSLRSSPASADRAVGEMLGVITELAGRIAKLDQALSSNDRRTLELTRSQLDNVRGQLLAARKEIYRLRVIKGQINFDQVDEPHKVTDIFEAIVEIFEQIRDRSVPTWTDSQKNQVDDELSRLITQIRAISDDIIPF